ncbi:hypothetical protein GCK32_007400, partial [Trichostrongylus colubriformis]
QANLSITFMILFMAMYASLSAILGRELFHPYSNTTFVNESTMDEMVSSTFSIFFFWMASLVVGHLVTYLKLPSLFGESFFCPLKTF